MTFPPTRSSPAGLAQLLEVAPWRRPAVCDLTVVTQQGYGSEDLWARCYRADRLEHGVLVWAHGGSWTGGSVGAWDEPCHALAAATGWAVASLEYRLAPRWPYPAPVDDLVRAVRWLLSAGHASVDAPVAVGGDSAGATIAAAAAVRLRDEGVDLAAQLLAYPPLDPECALPSYHRVASSWPVRSTLLDAWVSYRGHADQPSYLTPWLVEELAGVAPAAIAVGALDPVVDDCRDYADRLRRSGVTVDFEMFPGAGHGLIFARDGSGHYPVQRWFGRALARIARTPS